MANISRRASDVLRVMRLAIGRRNENDPDSNDETLIQYVNDAYCITMSDDVKLFEQFGTLIFTIDESNQSGVYTLNDVGAAHDYVSLSQEAYISLLDPVDNSVSWNALAIYRDPGDFFATWGINNDEILIPGYPTEMLFYGNEMTFRTIPNTSYQVRIYGYKSNPELISDEDSEQEGNPELPFAYWYRYLAYLAALNYVNDFRYSEQDIAATQKKYARERKLMLTRTHNNIKQSRALPRF